MFGIVIDKDGYKIEFVVLDQNKKITYYELKDGEKVVEEGWNIANSMVKPKWDGEKWIETGTLEPIPEPQPTEIELLKEKVESQEMLINELLTEIIPNITGEN